MEFGTINSVSMVLYGTTEAPNHYLKEKTYDLEYNRIWNRATPIDTFMHKN